MRNLLITSRSGPRRFSCFAAATFEFILLEFCFQLYKAGRNCDNLNDALCFRYSEKFAVVLQWKKEISQKERKIKNVLMNKL